MDAEHTCLETISTATFEPAATLQEPLLYAFRGLSEAFSEATARRFQPPASIYPLIACKVHAAEFRSLRFLSPPYEPRDVRKEL